jgi:hypothetical protein
MGRHVRLPAIDTADWFMLCGTKSPKFQNPTTASDFEIQECATAHIFEFAQSESGLIDSS